MDLKEIRLKLAGNEDERAVSPVIGVILMVAITVILAAVIAAFVLDIGDLDDSAPNAQFEWNTTDDGIASITHTSGDDIALSNVEIDTTDGTFAGEDEVVDGSESDVNIDTTNHEFDQDEWTAGETIVFDDTGDFPDEVTITWESDGSSTIIADNDV